jgi:virginiamycin B lyase
MWFSEFGIDRIGRVSSSGSITEYPTSGAGLTAGAEPSGIVAGPNGDIWFTEYGTGRLGAIDPASGKLVGEYPVPAGASSNPQGIVVGPDGALWFTERGADQIGRLDPTMAQSGTSNGFSEFAIPSNGTHIGAQPVDLIDGPNGTMWATLLAGDVASIVPAGSGPDTIATITRFQLPTAGSGPEGLVLGPDGDIWVSEYTAHQLARVVPSSTEAGTSDGITEYPAGAQPLWLSDAGDGALWFTDNTDHELVRFDISSHATTVLSSAQGVTGDATADAEDSSGDLWFTEFDADKVGEVTISNTTTPAPIALSNLTAPKVSGTPKYKHTLSCNPGTWTGKPTFSYTWTWENTQEISPFTLRSKARTFGVKLTTLAKSTYFTHRSVFTSTGVMPVGTGSTLEVPDVPAGSSFSCGVTAKLGAQTVGGQSVAAQSLTAVTGFISSLTTIPFLITQQRLHNGRVKTLPAPHITPDIAVGATNTCFPGVWTGNPTLSFAWYKQGPVPKKRTITRTMVLLHQGQTFVVTPSAEKKDLVCIVTASNLAGKATALTNDYTVPLDPPVALQPPSVLIETAEPVTGSALVGAQGADVVAEQIDLTCDPPQWNRPDVTVQVGWYTVASEDPFSGAVTWQPFSSGATLDLDMRPGNLQLSAKLYCLVTGTTSHGASTTVNSGEIDVWNGCTEVETPVPGETPDVGTILANVAAVAMDAATGGVYLTASAAGEDVLGADTGVPYLTDPTSSTEVDTYGPNCEDYQKYWMGQGFTVKQQPGDGPS